MNNLRVLNYNGERVLLTKQVAEAYKTDITNVTSNFSNHKDKFEEGKHYYLLKGDELKTFKQFIFSSVDLVNNFDLVSKNARHLTLFTKRGAFLIAKSIDTDEAWGLYEQLVDHYFDTTELNNVVQNDTNKQIDQSSLVGLFQVINDYTTKCLQGISKDIVPTQIDYQPQTDKSVPESNAGLTDKQWVEFKCAVKERVKEIHPNTSGTIQSKYQQLYVATAKHLGVSKCRYMHAGQLNEALDFVALWGYKEA